MKRAIILLAAVALGGVALGQKTMKDWSQLPDKKFFKKIKPYAGIQYIKSDLKTEQVPELGKIGILSYAMFQPNFTQRGSSYVNFLTDAGEGFIVDILFDQALPGMEEAASNKGFDLMTPSEYLDTPQKQNAYDNTEFEPSKLMEITTKIAGFLSGNVQGFDGKGAPEGYRFIMGSEDIKMWRALGAFAGEMEVDALVLIEQTIYWDGKIFALGPTKYVIVGPNPVPYDEDKKYVPAGPLKGYLEGIIYGAMTIAPPKPYELARFKKKKLKDLNTDGLKEVYRRQTEFLVQWIRDEFADAAK